MQRKRFSNDPYSAKEVRLLLVAPDNARDRMLLTLGVYSGVRVNEMASLRVDKIDYFNNTITVWDDKHNQYRGSRKLKTRRKVKEGIWRSVKIPKDVMRMLQTYQDVHVPDESTYLWALSYKTLENIIQKWSWKVLKKKKSWHCLRDTFATLSREQGKSLEYVKKQLGDTGAMVLDRYSRISTDQWEREAERPLI